MKNSMIKQVAGLAAAACTTLVIFSAVAALADSDRAAIATGQGRSGHGRGDRVSGPLGRSSRRMSGFDSGPRPYRQEPASGSPKQE